MTKQFHSIPFTEETHVKLSIFKGYLKKWLPVFLKQQNIYWRNINIFDFFAGPGYDAEKKEGSPIIILNTVRKFLDDLGSNGLNIKLIFNEKNTNSFKKLQNNLLPFKTDNRFEIIVRNQDFEEAFNEYYNLIKCNTSANFLFMDQFGIKQIKREIFQKIIFCKQTDFLFFISSSTIKRFPGEDAVKKYFDLPVEEVKKHPYRYIHRYVLDYYRSLIPHGHDYYLAPFSIQKGTNIYGLIFGSHHLLGLEKFLMTSWKHDPERGDANFDIEEENIDSQQFTIFGELDKPSKLIKFEENLKQQILNKTLTTNADIYRFALISGFLPKHAKRVVNKMYKEGVIEKSITNISSKTLKKNSTIIQKIKLCHNQI